jgi:hypothetical protein
MHLESIGIFSKPLIDELDDYWRLVFGFLCMLCRFIGGFLQPEH